MGKKSVPKQQLPLNTSCCAIDTDSIGEKWEVSDIQYLAKLVALVAMGQISQARYILAELIPAEAAFAFADLKNEAIIKLTVQEKKRKVRIGYPRWQRDGFIFETISWIAARQVHGKHCLMKDPHTSSTSQGLDGLMLELSPQKQIIRTTIFEDKCTDEPAETFRYKVIPAFQVRHSLKKSAEVIAAATSLLGMAGIDDATAAKLASSVTNKTTRRYRAAFALTTNDDSVDSRKKIFAGFNKIDQIKQEQRLGASLIVPPDLRDWFDGIAEIAISYIGSLEENNDNV